jgi:hypothetical protein
MQAYKEWIDGISSLPWALASTALFLFAAWFSGRVVSSSGLGLDLRDKALRPIVHTGMGMLFLSMLSLVMSMAGLLGRHECRWLLCASGGVAFLFALSLLAKSSGFWLGSFRFIKRNWALLAVFSFVALLYLGNALCVPAGLALDEQGYQLPVPTAGFSIVSPLSTRTSHIPAIRCSRTPFRAPDGLRRDLRPQAALSLRPASRLRGSLPAFEKEPSPILRVGSFAGPSY